MLFRNCRVDERIATEYGLAMTSQSPALVMPLTLAKPRCCKVQVLQSFDVAKPRRCKGKTLQSLGIRG
jgi:hypothetical protein